MFFKNSNFKVEKKPILLRDALYSKLKSRNLEIEKCVAYFKETK